MGKIISKQSPTSPNLNPNPQQPSSSHLQNPSQTAYRTWLRSSKSINDFIAYLNSGSGLSEGLGQGEDQSQKIQVVQVYVSSLVDRERLREVLAILEEWLMGTTTQRMGHGKDGKEGIRMEQRAQLLAKVHEKLSNIYLIWSQLGPNHHLTAHNLHQKLLPQLTHLPPSQKLPLLYSTCQSLPSLDLNITGTGIGMNPSQNESYLDMGTIIKEAIRVNYPYLVDQGTLAALFQGILDREVVIEDFGGFCGFVGGILEGLGQGRVRECQQYAQKLYQILSYSNQPNPPKPPQSPPTPITTQLLQSSKTFLTLGYPQATLLIIECILKHSPDHSLPPSYKKFHLYTKIYAMFVYNFGEINLEFQHLEKMSISHVVHLMLRGNDVKVLGKLKDIYGEVYGRNEGNEGNERKGSRESKELKEERQDKEQREEDRNGFKEQQEQNITQQQFQKQLIQYIFSPYCNLQICLQIFTNPTLLTLPSSSSSSSSFSSSSSSSAWWQKTQQKLVQKLNESKFQVIIQNQAMIKTAVEGHLAGNPIYGDIQDKIQEILEIVRLLYMFGVNQKFGAVSLFYCPDPTTPHPQLHHQQRALHLFKSFISKYYISSSPTRTKKITLNPRSSSPINIDLNKPQSIFQISQYLYTKILWNGLNSMRDLQQIVFQHMVYFYRYDDVRAVIGNHGIVAKYQISIDMVQAIIINNIIQTLQKTPQPKKHLQDITNQLKLLRSPSPSPSLSSSSPSSPASPTTIQIQSIKAMVKLITQLNEYGIELTAQQKNRMDINVLYGILDRYQDRIQVVNFDQVYEEVRVVNADYVVGRDEKLMMTNQLLGFKGKLAAKAYQLGKKSLGNELIDQISRFNPPWLTTLLTQIFKTTPKIDKRIYSIALKSCSKGQDLQYLMQLWKQTSQKQRKKQKNFADLTQYFETGRQYLVIDSSFIGDQEKFRNYVAECQFNDQQLHFRQYQMFFVLLGVEVERGFHYGLMVGLDSGKIQTFLREGMKAGIINIFQCLKYLQKYFYFVWKSQQQKNYQIPIFQTYKTHQIPMPQQLQLLQALKSLKPKPPTCQFYLRILKSYLCSTLITQKFINTYFTEVTQNKNSFLYKLLIDETSRKSLLIGLREEAMGRSDIFVLREVCAFVLDVNLLDFCVFSVGGLVNGATKISEKCENVLQKIITLTTDNQADCRTVVAKFIQKIFSVNRLVEVLRYLKSRQNPIYRQYIKQRNLQIIQCLAMIQINQQLHSIIPPNFFQSQPKLEPVWPIPQSHYKSIKKCWTKTNIFVLSKVMYFIYGMNPEVQKKVWEDYLKEFPDQELREVKVKLDQLKKIGTQ